MSPGFRVIQGGFSIRVVLGPVTHLVASLLLLTFIGCDDPRPGVVVYVSADQDIARPVLERFQQHSGIPVEVVYDTEATKTTGLANRLRNEADNPRADVFWSSEVFQPILLAREGILVPHASEVGAELPEQFREAEGRWWGFSPRARVIVYSTDRVNVQDAPQTWMDLTDQRWKGRVAMADPRFGTTRGHVGAMLAYWDGNFMPGYFGAYLEGLKENDTRMLTGGNAAVVDGVARGEFDVGMTDSDDVYRAIENGWNVDMILPRHDVQGGSRGSGTLLIPNAAGIVNGASNPVAASQLVDFLLSAEVENMLAESASRNLVLRQLDPEASEQLQVADPLDVDLGVVADRSPEAVDQVMRKLAEPSS